MTPIKARELKQNQEVFSGDGGSLKGSGVERLAEGAGLRVRRAALGLPRWLDRTATAELGPGLQSARGLSVCRLRQCLPSGCEVGENSSVYPGEPVLAGIAAGWTGTRVNLVTAPLDKNCK